MGMQFKCPTCGQQAEIITGGFVVVHGSPTCPFVRTPGSHTPPHRPSERDEAAIARNRKRNARPRFTGFPDKRVKQGDGTPYSIHQVGMYGRRGSQNLSPSFKSR